MLAKKKPSKQKNMVMIIILIICFVAIGYMLLGQGVEVAYEDGIEDDLLSPGFMQVRKTRKVDDILKSLNMKFVEYDIYKRMKGGVSLPIVEDEDIGNTAPFKIKQFTQDNF